MKKIYTVIVMLGCLGGSLYAMEEGASAAAAVPADGSELHRAVREGNVAGVQSLLGEGVTVDEGDYSGNTPLHIASRNGHCDIVKLLLWHDAAPVARNQDGERPGDLTLNSEIKDLLHNELERWSTKVSEQDEWRRTQLHFAVWKGDLEEVRYLLSRGANPNAQAESLGDRSISGTPLHWASETLCEARVKLLLDYGADVHVVNDSGFTPLHVAVNKRNYGVIRLLLDRGVDADAGSPYGETPLQITLWHPSLWHFGCGAMDILLAHGADPKMIAGRYCKKRLLNVLKARAVAGMLSLTRERTEGEQLILDLPPEVVKKEIIYRVFPILGEYEQERRMLQRIEGGLPATP